MNSELIFTLNTQDETKHFAQNCSRYFKPGTSIGLMGELGAGKTTFCKFLLASYGYKAAVSSPSYVLQHIYELDDSKFGINSIEHWDLYRINTLPQELNELPKPDSIRLVEWADRDENYLKQLDVLIEIKLILSDKSYFRELTICGIDDLGVL